LSIIPSAIPIKVKSFKLEIGEGGFFTIHADNIKVCGVTSYYINFDDEDKILDIQLYQVDDKGFINTIEVQLSI